MSLIEIWKSSPQQLREKHVQQVMAFAGDGKLRDGNSSSQEFRDFLQLVASSHLARFAEECLGGRFDDGGLALQDVVNEIGRRLGFTVVNGRYRGTAQSVGFDGLWKSESGHTIVVEVKTTDAYRIDLDTLANYRKSLVQDRQILEESSSILIVVGRQDTGDLEAQIRGSKHAWDIRLISTDALRRLVSIKEEIEDPQTVRQISELLTPMEFTRLDGIIDLVFATASEVREDEKADPEAEMVYEKPERHPKFIPVGFNQTCAERIAKHLGVDLLRRSKATFASPDGETVLICSVSKVHGAPEENRFWFAFHPHQQATLERARRPYVAFGCGSPDSIVLFPFEAFREWLPNLNITRLPDREYWHVRLIHEGGRYLLRLKGGKGDVDISKYAINE